MKKKQKCVKTGKSIFTSSDKADEAIKRIRKADDKRENTPSRSYRCDHCGGYHLTSMGIPFSTREVKLKKAFEKFLIKEEEKEVIPLTGAIARDGDR